MHLFRAYPVWKLSSQVRQIANQHITDPDLDGDFAGGQVDALRHILWMALITQKYGARFARKLGVVHEKSNKLDFKKKKLEEYQLPDATSMMMDLLNNEIGIELGQRLTDVNITQLTEIVKQLVLDGKAWVIKKDTEGNFLDIDDKPIPKNLWLGKWNTPKVLVASNYRNRFDTRLPDLNGRNKRNGKRAFASSKFKT